jgi:hypothetical protein
MDQSLARKAAWGCGSRFCSKIKGFPSLYRQPMTTRPSPTIVAAALIAFAHCGVALAQASPSKPAESTPKTEAATSASAADQLGLSRMAEKAVAAGIVTCKDEVNALSRYLYKDTDLYADVAVTAKVTPDRNVFYNISSQRFDNANSINLIHATPNPDNKCNSVLTQVLPLPGESCLKVRETVAGEWTFLYDMAGVPIYERKNDPTTTAIFMPMGLQGCLVIRSFVRYP